ncbi:hypothetical protein [Gemmata sp.]|uniref:hypothetical protein n=1 Tax=Gemmata sp. TaxID=1914242 RepID=UPI003F6E9B6B
MTFDSEKHDLADRIGAVLMPVHRGAIQIGAGQLAIFGNDGYNARGVYEIAVETSNQLLFMGWKPTAVQVGTDRVPWVFTATPKEPGPGARDVAEWALWTVWKRKPYEGRTARSDERHQRQLARQLIASLGGGYTDATLTTPLAGTTGGVGAAVTSALMIAEVVASGGEDVLVELGGTPSPAKKLRLGGPDCQDEWVVLTADAGNRTGGGGGTATTFLPAGSTVRVWDSGDVDRATGRRLMVPANSPPAGE